MGDLENHVALSAEQSRGSHSSTSAHTPGPWRVSKRGMDNGFDIQWAGRLAPVYWPSGHEVARIVFKRLGRGGRFAGNDVDAANARLIAAAPDMLAALEACVASIELNADPAGPTETEQMAIDIASAAIAKATLTSR